MLYLDATTRGKQVVVRPVNKYSHFPMLMHIA